MKQKRTWKQHLLLLLSIICGIAGIITLIISIYGMTIIPTLAAQTGSDTETAKIGMGIIILVGALMLFEGIFGIVASRNSAKTAPFLVFTSIAFILCAIAVAKSTGGGVIQMFTSGKGKLEPWLIVVTVFTAFMDGLGYMIRSDYRKGR